MKYIKEFVKFQGNGGPHAARVIVRTNTYGNSIAHFNEMFEEVKKDFPNLDPDDAAVTHYAGQRYKRTYGIEFNVETLNEIPKNYEEIPETEMTL